jgi:hypothetical protein
MKAILGAISLALTLSVATCEPVHADPECVSKEDWVKNVTSNSDEIIIDRVASIPAETLAKLVDQYNHTPPLEKQIEAEEGVLLWGKAKDTGQYLPTALAGFFHNGCRSGAFEIAAPGAGQDNPA